VKLGKEVVTVNRRTVSNISSKGMIPCIKLLKGCGQAMIDALQLRAQVTHTKGSGVD